uniref:Ig-like domain-containing protein n=1 Tax=Sus scrofa TaxID=9823 RepID=A0A4X1VP35_PIG
MARGLQFLLLSCACSLAPAVLEVKVVCSEAVDLPCPVPWDPQVRYTVSWAKLAGGRAESLEVPGEELRSALQNGSSGAPSGRLYSLKIQNTTSCNSGAYRCTLEDPETQRNLSGTVILKVTGCSKGRKEDTFKKYRAEIVLLLALVTFYLTLIIFTCKFARQQSIFPDFSKPVVEHAFLPVTSPNKPLEPVTLHKTELCYGSYGDEMLQEELGNCACLALALCRLLRTAVLFHIWSASLNASFFPLQT